MRLVPARELPQEQTKGFQFSHSDIRSVENKLDKSTFDYQPTRAVDTVYHNGDKLRLVSVCIKIQITTSNNTDLSGWGRAIAKVENADPPTEAVARCYFRLEDVSIVGASDYARIEQNLTFLVPASEYYTISTGTDGDGVLTLVLWEEWDLH